MKRQKDYICLVFGIILVVVGVIALIYPEITFKRTKTVKLGPVSVEEPQKKIFTISPYLAVGLIGGGVVLVYMGIKK